MTREHPLLFTPEMVNALRNGLKWQTRRILRPQPEPSGDPDFPWQIIRKNCRHMGVTPHSFLEAYDKYREDDIVWVRERFARGVSARGRPWVRYWADEMGQGPPLPQGAVWKPSIHMPRELARFELEVHSVWIERLQSISSADAYAEGARCCCTTPVPICAGNIQTLAGMWDAINGKRATWESNPWVVAIQFCRPIEIVRSKNATHRKRHRAVRRAAAQV